MEAMKEATNYHETIRADFHETFDFIDDLRFDLEQWELGKIRSILEEGIGSGEFEAPLSVEVFSEMLIMLLKGLEIPFYLQDKYEVYTPYFKDLSRIMLKGIRK
jgi:hypothetical protein